MGKLGWLLILIVLAGCGDGASSGPGAEIEPAQTPNTDEAGNDIEPLTSYRFQTTHSITTGGLSDVGEIVQQLEGDATLTPYAIRIWIEETDGYLTEVVGDGEAWWEVSDDGFYEVGDDTWRFAYLALLPKDIEPFLNDGVEWQEIGSENHLGVSTTVTRRRLLSKDDWAGGHLSQLDVWRDPFGEVVKFTAWFATGSNDGFPVGTWEVTERNPVVEIPLPFNQP